MIYIPSICPSCGSPLEEVNEQLFCRSKDCPAQTLKRIQHFCKVMGIKGAGEKTLEKLDLETISDLFEYSVHYYIDCLGETIGRKLHKEVHAAKDVPLNTSIAAFSIPLIGETAAKKLAVSCRKIEDINLESCKAAKLGDKATANLLAWLKTKEYLDVPIQLSFNTEITAETTSSKISVCITGKLNDYKNRTDAAKYLESLGFEVTSDVTKKTKVLIDEEGRASSKREKAEKLTIPIITIEKLIKEYI